MRTKTRTHDFYKVDDKTTTTLPHYSLLKIDNTLFFIMAKNWLMDVTSSDVTPSDVIS